MPKEISRMLVAVKDIRIGEDFNCRKSMQGIDDLADDIKKNGLIQPLVVRESGPDKDGKRGFLLVAGERRYRAVLKLGWSQVEIKMRKMDAKEARQVNYAENAHRMDLEPFEEAERLRKIMEEDKLTQVQLARKIGKSEPYVSQRLALLKNVASEVKKAVEDKVISPTHAREIATLTQAQQKEIVKEAEERKAKTGKAPSLSALKDSIDAKKAESRKDRPAKKKTGRPALQEYDHEKIKAAKEFYGADTSLVLKPKQAFLEAVGILNARLENPNLSDDRKKETKVKLSTIEFFLSQRDTL